MTNTLPDSALAVSATARPPRLALVGCGAIAEEYYLPAMARDTALAENLILVDKDIDRVRETASRYRVKTVEADFRNVLDRVEGVVLAVPTALHYPIAKEFLGRGTPVLCEKPLAESAEKARDLVRLAESHGVTLAVNYFQRLIPTFAKVKELLAEGAVGELRSIRYSVGEEFRWPTKSGFYFNSPLSSRGVLRDRGAHVIDHICWWLGGKPSLISSRNDSFGGSEAVAVVLFSFDRGEGEVRLNWLANAPCLFRLAGERGTIEGDVYDYRNLTVRETPGAVRRIAVKSTEKTKVDIAVRVVANFVKTIARTEPPLIAGRDVLDSIVFIDECYEAARPLPKPWYETLGEFHAR